ncbi:sensor histidine kinase [Actinoplanes friuliensis]|uniref:histidine kinase n=1 Tax=Actinoplanes friuliensis DSM 7358 TaxID=1246995 RepID=U5VTB1_9ACTN|nr:histidine kinase [Actinoplanes friuliensis]AGZ38975.1 histidine kinase [Actinoplanes friuliensis DSM 7358]
MELGGWHETRVGQAVRHHPLLCDAALGVALAIFAVIALRVGPHGETPRSPGVADVFAIAVAFLAVSLRRVRTRPALIVAAIAWTAVVGVHHERQPVLTAALVVLLFTHASRTDRRTAWITAGCVAAALYLAGVAWGGGGWWAPENLGGVAWIGMATAIGDATRSRRAYVAEVEERARRAEQSRDEEARRRVVEERVRIARELHDVVAHHIAVIKVQATGAKHILAHRPERVGPALDHISRSSDAVLKEIASVVGLLRSSENLDGDPAPATEPTRGLARLSGLLDDLAAAGLRVDHHQIGESRELPALVDLAAFRIAQEALTNAQKYGDGTARLIVAYTGDGVTLDITNPVKRENAPAGSGYGILGMRERAASTGGLLTACPGAQGLFAVHAELPSAALEPAAS